MNPEIKAKWVEALRSGKYKQGQEQLRTLDDNFCCLGVLCEIAVQEGVIESPAVVGEKGSQFFNGYSYQHYACFLPPEVRKWAGILGSEAHLVEMNDVKKNKFKTIANYIEENL